MFVFDPRIPGFVETDNAALILRHLACGLARELRKTSQATARAASSFALLAAALSDGPSQHDPMCERFLIRALASYWKRIPQYVYKPKPDTTSTSK